MPPAAGKLLVLPSVPVTTTVVALVAATVRVEVAARGDGCGICCDGDSRRWRRPGSNRNRRGGRCRWSRWRVAVAV